MAAGPMNRARVGGGSAPRRRLKVLETNWAGPPGGNSLDGIREAAARWVVRLQDEELPDAELAAFDAWLEGSQAHRNAFDRALDTWIGADAALARERAAPAARRAGSGARGALRPALWIAGGALAAAVGGFALLALPTWRDASPPAQARAYATARGERRTVALADGSRIELNAATRIAVELQGSTRKVTLEDGEVVLQVKHDPSRPFVVVTAGGVVQDLGTEFDIRQRNGTLSVTVGRGEVEFEPSRWPGGHSLRLGPGDRLERTGDGAPTVRRVPADEAFAWRRGELVLRDQPLGNVAAELNLYFDRPIRVADRDLASRRVSGVLRLGDQASTLRRLALFTPFRTATGEGFVLLQPVRPPVTAATP